MGNLPAICGEPRDEQALKDRTYKASRNVRARPGHSSDHDGPGLQAFLAFIAGAAHML